jgi:hypothetical protein
MITAIVRIEPSEFANYHYGIKPGQTITEIIRSINTVPSWVWDYGKVAVGGVPVLRAYWDKVKVKSSTYVNISVYPKGGSGGGAKDIISTIATIALIAGATAISGGALAPFLGGGFVAGSLGASAAALGLTVVGSLALQALAPPPVATNLDSGIARDDRVIAGIQGNPLARFDYLERVMGTMRASPRHLMLPFNELTNDEVVANALVGLAGKHQIEELRINGAPIDDFTGVEYEVKTGEVGSNDNVVLFDGRSAVEQSFGETLSNFNLQDVSGNETLLVDQVTPENSIPKFNAVRTKGEADEIDINLYFPAGLIDANNNPSTMPIAVQIKQKDSDTWINMPEFWFQDYSASGIQKRQRIKLKWVDEVPADLDFATKVSDERWAAAAIYEGNQSYQWLADSYFDGSSSAVFSDKVNADKDGFIVYLDKATFPKGEYDVRVKRGLAWGGNATTYSTYSIGGSPNADHYNTRDVSAPYSADNNQDDRPSIAILETVNTISYDYPFSQNDLTLIAIKAQNVKVSSISAKFTSIVEARDLYVWHFKTGVQNWTHPNGAAPTQTGTKLVHAPADADPILLSPELSFSGSDWTRVRVKAKRTAGSSWEGSLFWRTGGATDYTSSKVISEPSGIDSDYVVFEFDMTSLTTSAGHDWEGETITGIELHLIQDASSALDIDYVVIGKADGESWQEAPSNNPAAIYRHILSSSLNAEALLDSQINDTNLVDFYERCLDKGYECNYVTQQMSVDQHKQIVAQTGWGVPQQSETWGVIQERDRSADDPIQIFSQRNSSGFIVKKTFADLPYAIVGQFLDEENDYLSEEVITYFPGYNVLNATKFVSIEYTGITNRADVIKRSQLDIDQLIYRQSQYELETDIRHLNAPRGSLVAVSNDFLSVFFDSAFITAVNDDGGGNITSIELDSDVVISESARNLYAAGNLYALSDLYEASAQAGAVIQLSDGTAVTVQIDETETTSTLTFTTPLSDPGTLVAGLPVAVGPYQSEIKRCIINSIERVEEFRARVKMVDEAPQIHQS